MIVSLWEMIPMSLRHIWNFSDSSLPDASNEVSGGTNYAIGEYFKSGTYKVTVTDL